MLEAKIDYLEFTVPADAFYDLVAMFPGGVEPLEYGWRGYAASGLVAGGKGRVGWHIDRPEMGVHVSLGAQALGILAGLDDRWLDLPGMLAVLRDDLGGHVTRLDVAWDDQEGALDLLTVREATKKGNFTTRWKGGYRRDGWGNQEGDTLYFGSRSSDAFLCFYDKRQERLAKGHLVDVDHWVRVELRLRRKRAEAAAAAFQRAKPDQEGVFRHLAGVLRGYLEFKTPNATDSNKRRWKAADWWLAFLGHVSKAKLAVEVVKRTIDHVKGWVWQQVAPSLALIQEVNGSDWLARFVRDAVKDGRARWGPRHDRILKNTREAMASAVA